MGGVPLAWHALPLPASSSSSCPWSLPLVPVSLSLSLSASSVVFPIEVDSLAVPLRFPVLVVT